MDKYNKEVVSDYEAKLATGRGQRLARVQEEIKIAEEQRAKKEKETGEVEAAGAKSDREAEEKAKLDWASETRMIDLVEGSGGNELMNTVIARLNDVISYINDSGDHGAFKKFQAKRRFDGVVGMKATDSLYYNETGNMVPPPTANSTDSGEYDGEKIDKKDK